MNAQNKEKNLKQLQDICNQTCGAAEAAEVFLTTIEETPVHLESNRVKSIRSRQSQIVALRIFINGRIGYATSNSLENPAALINAATETATFGSPANFEFPGPMPFQTPEIFDSTIPSISLKTMVGQAEQMTRTLGKHTQGLVCEGGVSRETATVSIVNSSGISQSYNRTEYAIGIGGVLTRGTDMLFVSDEICSCQQFASAAPVVESVIRQLEWGGSLAGIITGKVPAIFLPSGVASALLAPLMVGFNGKMVLEKASPLAGKAGRKLLDEKFNLSDDATLALRPTSRPFDDEGIPSKPCPLVENGVVKSFYYDLRTAALAGTKSTGHGHRTPGQSSPTPSAFIISAGDTALSDMIADIDEGLIIEQLMGASQGNILGGDFSGNVLLGYKIENGRIVGRVKDTVVFGNVYALLKEIVALGSDARWIGGLFSPSIFVPALSVSSRG